MTVKTTSCPNCQSPQAVFSQKRQIYVCPDCDHKFSPPAKIAAAKRIFLSYGHDEFVPFAEKLKNDFEQRGHEVWYDAERIRLGGDWERYIEEGLNWVTASAKEGRFVLLMTPHSVRRPKQAGNQYGYCLNELARALSRGFEPVPVMLSPCEPPLSICRIQYLDMQNCWPLLEGKKNYQSGFKRLAEAIEQDRLDFEGAQSRLCQRLEPLPFEADMKKHLARFTGRQWVFDEIDRWLANPRGSRVFWICGSPGVGKSAIAVWLCTYRPEVAAFHLCIHGHTQKADPRQVVKSIAFQLSTQLYDYQQALNASNLEKILAKGNPQTLFDSLIVQPLSRNFPRPANTVLILIDALDEATENGRNELAAFIAGEAGKLPEWIRLIITSRPEPEVTTPLQGLKPYQLDASRKENKKDLRTYLQRELAPLAEGGQVSGPAMDTLLEKSEGLFLYADWVREELKKGHLSLGEVEQFPRGLGGIYLQFFERQFPDRSRFSKKYRSVIETVAAARENLTVNFLCELFDWTDYEQHETLDALGSLFPMENGNIRPFHRSVIDWLTDPKKAGPYLVSIQAGHERLAESGWQDYLAGGDGLRMDDYHLQYLSSHLAQWAARVSEKKRCPILDRLVTLIADPAYQKIRMERVWDPVSFLGELRSCIQHIVAVRDPKASVLLARAALGLVSFQLEELRPEVVFLPAEAGQLKAAEACLALFPAEVYWQRTALLSAIWLAANNPKHRKAAEEFLNELTAHPLPLPEDEAEMRPTLVLLDFLQERVRATLEGRMPGLPPQLPTGSEEGAKAVLESMGMMKTRSEGISEGGAVLEFISGIVAEPMVEALHRMGDEAPVYVAQRDGPALVGFATADPQRGKSYLERYIDLHAANNYVPYRNLSLWLLLGSVLQHPLQDWTRDLVVLLVKSALARERLIFREALPFALQALEALQGKRMARKILEERVNEAHQQVSELHESRGLNDSWASHKRRLAALAEACHILPGAGPLVDGLLNHLFDMAGGFAGYQAPAWLTVAETVRICRPDDTPAIKKALAAAEKAAHNIQDAVFCARVSARVSAMRKNWWKLAGSRIYLPAVVERLATHPQDPKFAAVHVIGEDFSRRTDEPGKLDLPDSLKKAQTLNQLAVAYQRPLPEFQQLNKPWASKPDEPIPDRREIKVPDPEFIPLLAARLAAETLVAPGLNPGERVALIKPLVPLALNQFSALDTVLARLLLGAKPTDKIALAALQKGITPGSDP